MKPGCAPAMFWSFLLLLSGCAATAPTEVSGPSLQMVSMNRPVAQRTWENPYGRGHCLSTRHFDIYTTVTDKGVAEYLPGFMESAFANYATLTGIPDFEDGKGKLYLLANRQQWADLTRALVRDQPESYLSIRAGGYCYRGTCVFWDIAFMHTLPVAAHEGLHQYFANHLKDSLPMWAEEGLCVTAEGFVLDAKDHPTFSPNDPNLHGSDLRLALNGKGNWVPLRRLLEMDAGDAIAQTSDQAVSYYAQLYALLLYIRKDPHYRAGLEHMIADARDGRIKDGSGVSGLEFMLLKADPRRYNRQLSEPMFRHYICEDLDGFERGFNAFAQTLTQPHAAAAAPRQVAANK